MYIYVSLCERLMEVTKYADPNLASSCLASVPACVCMCVCWYVCMHACMRTCMYLWVKGLLK